MIGKRHHHHHSDCSGRKCAAAEAGKQPAPASAGIAGQQDALPEIRGGVLRKCAVVLGQIGVQTVYNDRLIIALLDRQRAKLDALNSSTHRNRSTEFSRDVL